MLAVLSAALCGREEFFITPGAGGSGGNGADRWKRGPVRLGPALRCSLPAALLRLQVRSGGTRCSAVGISRSGKGLLRSELLPSESPPCGIIEGDGRACRAKSA